MWQKPWGGGGTTALSRCWSWCPRWSVSVCLSACLSVLICVHLCSRSVSCVCVLCLSVHMPTSVCGVCTCLCLSCLCVHMFAVCVSVSAGNAALCSLPPFLPPTPATPARTQTVSTVPLSGQWTSASLRTPRTTKVRASRCAPPSCSTPGPGCCPGKAALAVLPALSLWLPSPPVLPSALPRPP